ncbi:hypothetical protein TKK_0017154 [Trichogramma kaykai]
MAVQRIIVDPAPRVKNNLMGSVKQSHLVIDKEVIKELRTTDYQYTVTERVREKCTELPPTRFATDTLNKEMFKTVMSKFDNAPQNFTANKLRPDHSCYPSMPTEDELNLIEQAESLIDSQAEGDLDDEPYDIQPTDIEPSQEVSRENHPIEPVELIKPIKVSPNAMEEETLAGILQ